jgi:hypothetical protein
MATMVTAQEITLDNFHEHLEIFDVWRNEEYDDEDFECTFRLEIHWDRENGPLNKIMAREFRNYFEEVIGLDEVNEKRSMMWANSIKEISGCKKGVELFIIFDYFEDGFIFVGGHHHPKASTIQVDKNGYVSLRMWNNYSTAQTDNNILFVRVRSLYNDQVHAELDAEKAAKVEK